MISVVLVIPFVLITFDESDVVLYFLFMSVISMQIMISSAFVSSFSRYVSYCFSGANKADLIQGYEEQKITGTDAVELETFLGLSNVFLSYNYYTWKHLSL